MEVERFSPMDKCSKEHDKRFHISPVCKNPDNR